MTMGATWSQVETAEELFASLGVAFDATVLRTYRVPILKRFGLAIAQLGTPHEAVDEDERRRAYRRLLEEVYESYAAGTARGGYLGRPRDPPLYSLRRPRRPAES
jgi:hypothetical protein